MTLHVELAERVVERYGERLAQLPRLAHDALGLDLDTGTVLEVRFASADEYSIHWRRGDEEQRIDTAPLHPQLASFPNHRHEPDGTVHADTLTQPGREPWDNLRAVLDALLGPPP